jgi:hypothetical protein
VSCVRATLISACFPRRISRATENAADDACDEYGVLLYHDLQIAAKNNYTLDGGRDYNVVVPRELRYQLARNSHHPSIAMYLPLANKIISCCIF